MHAGPWRVSLRWVLDSEKYNEWMNPIDYETEEALAEQERMGLVIGSPKGRRPILHVCFKRHGRSAWG